METIRTISMSVDTVPHATAVTPSTFTIVGRKLIYAGPDDLRLTLDKRVNVWLYFPNAGLLVEVESYGEFGGYMPQGQTETMSTPEAGQIVEKRLVYYELVNISSSGAATVNGNSLNAGTDPIRVGIPGQASPPVTVDPVLVDATNAEVRVVEQR